nr:RHS repeat-associated core domain-containing protein [Treponema pedis]
MYGRLKNVKGERTFIPFRQAGQIEDAELEGLYYNRYRWYNSEVGTYISQDPIGLAGGNPTLYGYVFDPNSWVDVFGLENDFLQDVQNSISRTGQKFQGAEIYVFDKKTTFKGIRYNKGDYFYLDNFHKDHYEVFDSKNKSKAVINLDGSLNEKKTKKSKNRTGCRGK